MTILVTGATGLVGTRLLPRLVAAGFDCRVLVRAAKKIPDNVEAVEGDILDPASLGPALKGVNAVVHLAARIRTQDEDEIWQVNLNGTRNLIAAVQEHAPQARFIMASTGLVYKRDLPRPAVEGDPTEAIRPYPASKIAAGKELQGSRLNWSELRLAFVYGDDGGHMASLPKLAKAWKWHPATTLSLIHHRDVATAFELALAGAMDNKIVNVADEAPTSVYEIAKLVHDPMEPSAEPLANPWMGRMDTSLARSLGFQPKVKTLCQAIQLDAL